MGDLLYLQSWRDSIFSAEQKQMGIFDMGMANMGMANMGIPNMGIVNMGMAYMGTANFGDLLYLQSWRDSIFSAEQKLESISLDNIL